MPVSTILGGEVLATNLPWKLSEGRLSQEIGSARVRLLNDLETTAYGALFPGPDEILDTAPKRVPI
jgi:glucokinase